MAPPCRSSPPTGSYLAFVRNGALFRAALTGGAPTRIADGIDNPRGIDWCGDEIVFNRDASSGLFKVSTRRRPRDSSDFARSRAPREVAPVPPCTARLPRCAVHDWDQHDRILGRRRPRDRVDGDGAIPHRAARRCARPLQPEWTHRLQPGRHAVRGRVRPGAARGHGAAGPGGPGRDERTGRRLDGIRTGAERHARLRARSIEDGGSPAGANRSPRRRGAVPGDTPAIRQLPAVARRAPRGGADTWRYRQHLAVRHRARRADALDHRMGQRGAHLGSAPAARSSSHRRDRARSISTGSPSTEGRRRANRGQRVHEGPRPRGRRMGRRSPTTEQGDIYHRAPRARREADTLRELQGQGTQRRLLPERRLAGLRLRRERAGRSLRATVSRGRGPPARSRWTAAPIRSGIQTERSSSTGTAPG